MTHPYFVAKAREVFAGAGGDPEQAGPLATWAEGARRREPQPHGVIVLQDGTLVAETAHVSGRGVGATYVRTPLIRDASSLAGIEVGLAVHRCLRLLGQGAAEIRVSEVCFGSGKR